MFLVSSIPNSSQNNSNVIELDIPRKKFSNIKNSFQFLHIMRVTIMIQYIWPPST